MKDTLEHSKDENFELSAMAAIASAEPDHPGYEHCRNVITHLLKKSDNGIHLAIVQCICGTTLNELLHAQPRGRFLPTPVVARVVKQLLLALDYLCTKAHVVHTDIHGANIFVDLRDAEHEDITAFLARYPSTTYPPRTETRLSSDPIVTVKSESLPSIGLKADLSNLWVKLGDFSSAQLIEHTETGYMVPAGDFVQPHKLRAPEVILGHPWAYPVDVWTIGCMAST
jgi:serine/threonine-protein kinase SRPK3